MLAQTLLPNPPLLHLLGVASSTDAITLVASTIQPEVVCPLCGSPTSRVHSRYLRTLSELPCLRLPVRVHLHTRRFFCDRPECPRAIFTERLPDVALPYARRTARLAEALQLIAHALGGEAGARLAARLGMPVSADTLLRQLAGSTPPATETPRVLGVDDWALCRGQRYGTILVDLERQCVIDLLPDRRPETLAAWLKEHPGVEIIARDRAGAYAEGARQGAPEAVQVADRWHLVKNLVEALEGMLAREERALQEAAGARASGPEEAPRDAGEATTPEEPAVATRHPLPRPQTRAEQESAARRERRHAVYEEVRRLYEAGHPIRHIAQQTGKDHRTVRKYLRADAFPERKKRAVAPSQLEEYREYLERRWREGCHNATQLWRELREQGFAGGCSIIKHLLCGWRAQLPPEQRRANGKAVREAAEGRAPAPRTLVWWLLGSREKLTEEQVAFLERLKTACPKIATAQELVLEFLAMARRREGDQLEGWVMRAAASGVAELKSFGTGLRRDWEAVVAGLTLEWSNGPVEGQINRLKLIKREMFGRAGLALLRARVLAPAPSGGGGARAPT
jgi:transposase